MSIAVLLAAGKSSRTTVMKPLYRVGGRPLVDLQIATLRSYGYRVAVILGYRAEALEDAISEPCMLYRNEAYEEGMFSSVKVACRVLKGEDLLLCHIDRPVADRAVFEALEQAGAELAVARFRGERAPPVYLSGEMAEELIASPMRRLDTWVLSRAELCYVDVDDPRVVQNANTDTLLRRYFD